MEEKRLKLKRVKKKNKISKLFEDKKKRYLLMFLLMLPFLVAIGVFSSIAYREVKALTDLAKGGQTETKKENVVEPMNYILRDNPTDIQKEYFRQLKKAVEEGTYETEDGDVPADDVKIAEMVAKNYVADFYTWTNKRGQYDIGGLCYVYDGEYENGDHFKENVYLNARDGFYKYISYYGTQYGKENLLEVESVEVINCEKSPSQYKISQHVSYKQDEQGDWYDYREDHGYDFYTVKCRWTYKENTSLPMNQFATSVNLGIINVDGRFEIIEASENTINARTGSKEDSTAETTETVETETEEIGY